MRIAMLLSFVVTTVLAEPVSAHPAVMHFGNCGIALMEDGDVFLSVGPVFYDCIVEQGPWSLSGNVFSISGRAPNRIAGMTVNAQILAANGDWFQLYLDCSGGLGTPMVTFLGNAFEMAGVGPSAGEEFTDFGGSGPAIEYALTTLGNVYRWRGSNCYHWTYVGALPIGPTLVRGESWGRLKIRYR